MAISDYYNQITFGGFTNRADYYRRMPLNRIAHLKKAIYKLYFLNENSEFLNREKFLFQIGNLIFFYQELRSEIRQAFDKQHSDIVTDEMFSANYLTAQRVIDEGFKILEGMPYPKPLPPIKDANGNFDIESEEVEITLNPKKKAFPASADLFSKIADEEHFFKDEKTFLKISKMDFAAIEMEEYFNKLLGPAFAILVKQILDEIKGELRTTTSFHAKIPVANISDALNHFHRVNQNSDKYTDSQIAFEVSLNYKNMHTEEPFKYKSVADYLRSK